MVTALTIMTGMAGIALREGSGEVVIPRTDVFGWGEFAQFRGPDGNVIGLWRDAPATAAERTTST